MLSLHCKDRNLYIVKIENYHPVWTSSLIIIMPLFNAIMLQNSSAVTRLVESSYSTHQEKCTTILLRTHEEKQKN